MRQTGKASDGSGSEPGLLARLFNLAPHNHPSDHRTYETKDGDTITITCEGCGAATEVDIERGRAADNPGVGESYFSRPCPSCGREMVATAQRRPF